MLTALSLPKPRVSTCKGSNNAKCACQARAPTLVHNGTPVYDSIRLLLAHNACCRTTDYAIINCSHHRFTSMGSGLRKRLKSRWKGDARIVVWQGIKLLYVRIPKNANTSIRLSIEGGIATRMSASKIKALQDDWVTFSFVRNPWARLVSTYTQKASLNATSRRMVNGVYEGFIEKNIPVYKGISFDEFCRAVCDLPDDKTDKHLRSQSSFLIRDGKPIVKMVGKVENMDDDWKAIMDLRGLDVKMNHLNKTSRHHYSDYYADQSLINLVGDRYAEDIRNFNYQFSTDEN